VLIRNYGLFWRTDEVVWNPGKGARGAFRLLGRRGSNRPKLRLADFRHQQGIYILYSDYGPYYVGLTEKQGLGKRLKDHLGDDHRERWDRFSWFGFRKVLAGRDDHGVCTLKDLPEAAISNPAEVIRDVEALLIRAMGLRNINVTNFTDAEEWTQVKIDEVERYMGRVTQG
jgi:hypothetical protein